MGKFAFCILVSLFGARCAFAVEYEANAYAGKTQLTEVEGQQREKFCLAQNLSPSQFAQCMNDGRVPTAQTAAVTCSSRLNQLLAACTAKTQEATNSCDESNNSGMAQAQQAAVVLGQQVSASVQAACSSMGKISQAANAATAAYQMSCSSSVSTCTSACQDAVAYYNSNRGCAAENNGVAVMTLESIQSEKKSCTDLKAKADTAQQAMNNFLQTTLQAQNCSNESSGTSNQVTPELCAANPNIAGCTAAGTVDCTKPELASTNKVCICSKNPNDPQCMSGQSAGNSTSLASMGTVSSGRTADASGPGGDDMFGLPPIDQAPVNRKPGDAVEGKQGAGAPLGSDGGGSSSGGAAGKAGAGGKATDPVQVTAGFYSGGGGSWGGGSGGAGEKNPQGLGGLAAKAAVPGGPNLRQFLPGGAFDPRRGVAGASGPDGITGPNSNIWQKIQNRYQVVGPSLMP